MAALKPIETSEPTIEKTFDAFSKLLFAALLSDFGKNELGNFKPKLKPEKPIEVTVK